MVRPRKDRLVGFNPEVSYYKPRGIPMVNLDEVRLTIDEREAIRLSDLLGMSQEEAGRQMGVSRATFGRIIQQAHKVVADALINGKAINIEGGNYKIVADIRRFQCHQCDSRWEEDYGTGRPSGCPNCSSQDFYRVVEDS